MGGEKSDEVEEKDKGKGRDGDDSDEDGDEGEGGEYEDEETAPPVTDCFKIAKTALPFALHER